MVITLFSVLPWLGGNAQAQWLPDNKTLNAQSVQRWMHSNRDMASVLQVLDAMHADDEAMKAFESLSAPEQDKKIDAALAQHNMQVQAKAIAARHGWQSVGEYMRLSGRLGNAIAAYFLWGDLGRVGELEQQALREKADPAVLAVPQGDIAFVKANEKILQHYIQAYGGTQ